MANETDEQKRKQADIESAKKKTELDAAAKKEGDKKRSETEAPKTQAKVRLQNKGQRLHQFTVDVTDDNGNVTQEVRYFAPGQVGEFSPEDAARLRKMYSSEIVSAEDVAHDFTKTTATPLSHSPTPTGLGNIPAAPADNGTISQ